MKIIFYCQYVWGMGHLFRSMEVARALAGHEVILVAGGREIEVRLPPHVTCVRLPGFYMDEQFTTLIPEDPDKAVEDIQRQRREMLFSLFTGHKPDLLVIELYPFGRTLFGFELQPLLDAIRQGRFGKVKVVCSLRDILVEKRDQAAYEARVLSNLSAHFDLLLIHSDPELMPLDETFSRVDDIRIPIFYTGFVAQKIKPGAGKRLRQELALGPREKLIVASAGGGRSGYTLLSNLIGALDRLPDSKKIRMEMFAGPFRDERELKKLSAHSNERIRVRRFSGRFLDYLSAADLSVSLAGYNTCMNLLVTRTPALVYPYLRQREQPMRVAKIKNYLPMKILTEADMGPDLLAGHMLQMLQASRPSQRVALNLEGAENTARYLNEQLGSQGSPVGQNALR
jgi:predicted glycosyltransferase